MAAKTQKNDNTYIALSEQFDWQFIGSLSEVKKEIKANIEEYEVDESDWDTYEVYEVSRKMKVNIKPEVIVEVE